MGGHVTATGRSQNADLVRGLGAERYGSADDLARQAAGEFDVVIDTVGEAVLDGSYDLLRAGGRRVTLSAPPDQDRATRRDIRAVFLVVTADPAAPSGP
jgi:NADPH:quinone reductase-like Zn-dependent oxidoreductase